MFYYHFSNIKISCFCGIEEDEKKYKQNISIELKLGVKKRLSEIQDLNNTINYYLFLKNFIENFKNRYYPTLENLAYEIKLFIKENYPEVKYIYFNIKKNIQLREVPLVEFEGGIEL